MMKMTDPLARKVREYAGKRDMLPQGGTVLCAVSGGRDSMALLHLLMALGTEFGFRVEAGHFNHQLRDTANRDEDFVRTWCGEHGVPFTCGRGDAAGFAKREGRSTEDAARILRYAFLEGAAEDMGADRIATAHHREDNAETLLLHLIRGAGLQGLGGIPPVRGRVVRPLLEISRGEINGYIERNGIPFVEDESNQDRMYTRNRLRLEVLPLLEEIAPGAGGRIAGTAALVREENEFIRREAERLLPVVEDGRAALAVSVLDGADEVLGRRLVREMARKLGVTLDQRQTEAVLGLKNGGFLNLPGGLCAVRTRRELAIERVPEMPETMVLHEGTQVWGPWRVTLERRAGPVEDAAGRVVLRDSGEVLSIAVWDGSGRLNVENGSRTVKRLFADRGIPVADRGAHPAVLADGELAAVFGVASDWARRPVGGEAAWVLTLRVE